MVLLNTAHIKFKLRKTLHLSSTWQHMSIPVPPHFQPSTYCILRYLKCTNPQSLQVQKAYVNVKVAPFYMRIELKKLVSYSVSLHEASNYRYIKRAFLI